MFGVWKIVAITLAVGISSTDGVFQTMRALTYNTGLIESVVPTLFPVTREQRRAKIIQDLIDTDASIVCLQELYYAEDLAAVVEGVKDKYQYSFSKIHNEDGTVDGAQGPPNAAVCDPAPYAALSACLGTSCPGVTDYAVLISCSVQFCGAELNTVLTTSSQDCISCFVAALPNMLDFFTTCTSAGNPTLFRKINAPGLLLLSKIPLSEAQYVDYHSGTVEAFHNAYLQAKVGRKVKNIQAVCTHMSVINVPVYFEVNLHGQFSSFAEQNMNEVKTLIQKFGTMPNVVLFGDFNVGPASAVTSAVGEANYNALAAVFDTSIDACTICATPENPYNLSPFNSTIDHVFARGFTFRNARRKFTTDESSLYIGTLQVPYSDHFGFSVQLQRIKGRK